MNQKSYTVTVFIPLLLLLGACGGKKPQRVSSLKRSSQVAMPVPRDDQNIELSFFDEEVGAFNDVESFVLDNDANQVNIALAFNDSDAQLDFNLEETTEADQDTQVVFFDFDSYKIKDDQKPAVAELKKKITQWVKDGKKVVFKGHSCKWHGTRAYNLALSGQRAQWIADYCKVPKDNVKVFGVGSEEPLVFDNSKDGQGPNRRVEVYAIAA
jgi:outer membrane protein OmpA-like peptidoglycan-associated protein